MSGPVERLARQAVETGDRETLLEAFVAAARFAVLAEERGDLRDGLIDMPLPFDAAAKLGLEADAFVEQAAEHLTEAEEEILRAFAARPDRADVAAMGWDNA